MSRKVLLIMNPTARAGRSTDQLVGRFSSLLEVHGIELEVRVTRGVGDAVYWAELAGPYDCVVAGGGDGTVREVLTGCLNREVKAGRTSNMKTVPMSVLPLGTGNDVATLLGIRSVEDTVRALTDPKVNHWDAIEVEALNGEGKLERQYGVLFAACGFAGDLLEQTTPRVKRWFGPHMAYPVGFFRALARFRPYRLKGESCGEKWMGDWVVALAANAPISGGGTMQIGPGARMDDGLMDISLIGAVSRWELFWQFFRFVRGKHIDHPQVRYFPSETLFVASERPLPVAIDGDVVGTTPMRLRIRSRCACFWGAG